MTTSGLRVAVVAGGPSPEAEVSRTSARAVAGALERAGHRPVVIELDPSLPEALRAQAFDVVFPAVHGPMGEDGCLQGCLEVMALPYVGSGVLASALAMNKRVAKVMFRGAELPLAAEDFVRRGEDLAAAAQRVRERLGERVAVKPGAGGSAIGVTLVRSTSEGDALERALESALAADDEALVEAMVEGKESTCGVLEDQAGVPRPLPPTLIRPRAAEFYDFKAKYAAGGSEHVCPAPFEDAILSRIQEHAVRAHQVLGARDLSRVDFIVDEERGSVTLLEVNTLPGMTGTSLFPEAAQVAGISFEALVSRLCLQASARGPRRAVAAFAMP